MAKINPDNHQEPDWAELLDRLEAERTLNSGAWTEEQQLQLDELRILLAETTDALTIYAKMDVEVGWENLQALARERNLLTAPRLSKRTGKSRQIWSRVVAAASIVLALSFGSYYLHKQHTKLVQQGTLAAAADIKPGGNRAKLVLSNGKSIVLREDREGIAIHESGIAYVGGDLVSEDIVDVGVVRLEVPRTGQYKVSLPDGTNVWLNSESSLSYPMQFTGDTRRVELVGEAYFEVAHNPDQPFVVSTQTQEVTVLGTHFNIHAYLDEPVSRTTLIDGSVRVRLVNHTDELTLAPGEQAVTDFQTIQMLPADRDQVLAWKNGKFVFHGQDLASIMRQIARWYDVDVQFDQAALRQFKFGGTVSRKNNLSSVLKAMENTGNISFEVHGKNVIVRNVY